MSKFTFDGEAEIGQGFTPPKGKESVIVVFVRGGVVTSVEGTYGAVLVCDFDTQSEDEEDLVIEGDGCGISIWHPLQPPSKDYHRVVQVASSLVLQLEIPPSEKGRDS